MLKETEIEIDNSQTEISYNSFKGNLYEYA